MKTVFFNRDDAQIPKPLAEFRDILQGGISFSRRPSFCPSAVPVGAIRRSAFDENGMLWLVGGGNMLYVADLSAQTAENRAELTENQPVLAVYAEKGAVWAMTAEGAFRIAIAKIERPSVPDQRPARQKMPSYYKKTDARVPDFVRRGCQSSAKSAISPFLALFGTVNAVAEDHAGGLFLGTPEGVLHICGNPPQDQAKIELYAGARYLYGGDEMVLGVCDDGAEGFWIENALGFVHVDRPRYTLRQKADFYDTQADRLHVARGSLCDVICRCYDAGNDGKLDTLYRYSTNNDAFWSVLNTMGDAFKFQVLSREGEHEAAKAARDRMVRVTENILLQAHVHGFGNGFVCRSYVSVRDAFFVQDGRINTGGLWLRKGQKNEKGETVAVVEDTPHARKGRNDAEGHNMLLSDKVKEKLQISANHLVEDGFRLAVPQPGQIPPRLAKLFEEADPVHPHLFPASREEDLLFKTDTSSEEVIAAFIQYYFVTEYLLSESNRPEDAELSALIVQTASATLQHLWDNGFALRDVHGNPTQWGKWFADYFTENTENCPNFRHPEYAFADAPLNGAEYLCILRITMYLTENNPAYAAVYAQACAEYEKGFGPVTGENGAGYAHFLAEYQEKVGRHAAKHMQGAHYSFGINYSDEEMAIMTFWPLLALEQDENRRKIYRNGLAQWWDNMQTEESPLYTIGYAAMTQAEVPLAPAIETMRRLPLWLRHLPQCDTNRNDVLFLPKLPGERPHANRLLPVDQRRVHKANSNPFAIEDKPLQPDASVYDQNYVFCGSMFTLPYWAGRYFGFLDREQ